MCKHDRARLLHFDNHSFVDSRRSFLLRNAQCVLPQQRALVSRSKAWNHFRHMCRASNCIHSHAPRCLQSHAAISTYQNSANCIICLRCNDCTILSHSDSFRMSSRRCPRIAFTDSFPGVVFPFSGFMLRAVDCSHLCTSRCQVLKLWRKCVRSERRPRSIASICKAISWTVGLLGTLAGSAL